MVRSTLTLSALALAVLLPLVALAGVSREMVHAGLAFGQAAELRRLAASTPEARAQIPARLLATDACLVQTYGRASPWRGWAAPARELQSTAQAKFDACWRASA